MKRTDMINAITIRMEDIFGIPVYNEDAENVLDLIEKLGMLPPFVDQAVITMEDYFTLHTEQAYYNGVCKWEKE